MGVMTEQAETIRTAILTVDDDPGVSRAVARDLRRRGVANRIGFFLHVPWPSRRVLHSLPRHEELVEALLDYDLIGFRPGELVKLDA